MYKKLAVDMKKMDAELYKTTKEVKIIATILAGTVVNVVIDPSKPTIMTVNYGDISITCRSSKWNKYFKNKQAPAISTLMRWESEGICKSLSGKTVEPDGWDSDGTPSWLLALGLI